MPPKAKAPTKKLLKAFFKSLRDGNVDEIQASLAAGLDPNVRFDATGYGDRPALIYALGTNQPASARVLLDAGADVHVTTERGSTVLHDITSVELATELLDRGASLAATDSLGWTPLHTACHARRIPIVELFLARGAIVDAPAADGKPPYALAMDAKLRALLRQHGARGNGPGGGCEVEPTITITSFKDLEMDRGVLGVDRRGNVWFGGYAGLFRFDGTTLTRYQFSTTYAFADLDAGPGDTMYFATNWGLLQFDGTGFRIYDPVDSELFDRHLTHLRTNLDGHAYIIAYESEATHKHITVFDGREFRVLAPGVDFPPGLELTCLGFDGTGQLVLGATGGIALHKDGWTVIRGLDPSSSFAPRVHDIASSGDVLWIGAQNGVYEYRDGRFTLHRTENLAKCLCVDGDEVWIGMYYGGLGRLRAGELHVFQPGGTLLPHEDVTKLVRGADGRIWLHAGGQVAFIREGEIERLPT